MVRPQVEFVENAGTWVSVHEVEQSLLRLEKSGLGSVGIDSLPESHETLCLGTASATGSASDVCYHLT